jgi:hypothetical protein
VGVVAFARMLRRRGIALFGREAVRLSILDG